MTRAADVRLRGFAARASLDEVVAWLDAHAAPLGAVEVAIAESVGRILASPPAVPGERPARARAGEDGWAVRAEDTHGASAYAPVTLRVQDGAAPLAPGAAAVVAAGEPLPAGADAIVPFVEAEPRVGEVDVAASVAAGAGVERAAALGARDGDGPLVAPGGIRPHDAALLACAGVERVSVVRRPRVRLAIAGPKGGGADGHGAMLRALVARDGGGVEAVAVGAPLRDVLELAAVEPRADLVVATGRTGTGADDDAPLALADAGALAFHGIALRPGGSAAAGLAGGRVPVVLLPGDPLAALCAYELVAGRAVRRLAGRDPALPHATREVPLAGKLASSVGLVEVCQVRLRQGYAQPLGVADFGGLPAAAAADGFVVVPAPLEGWKAGARVTVHLY